MCVCPLLYTFTSLNACRLSSTHASKHASKRMRISCTSAPCPIHFQMQRIGLCTHTGRLQCRSLEASRQAVRRGDLHHVCMCVSTSDLYSSVIILLDSMCNPASIKLAANRARFAVVQSLSAKMAARIPSNADCMYASCGTHSACIPRHTKMHTHIQPIIQ